MAQQVRIQVVQKHLRGWKIVSNQAVLHQKLGLHP